MADDCGQMAVVWQNHCAGNIRDCQRSILGELRLFVRTPFSFDTGLNFLCRNPSISGDLTTGDIRIAIPSASVTHRLPIWNEMVESPRADRFIFQSVSFATFNKFSS
jgi:hypothetical protein